MPEAFPQQREKQGKLRGEDQEEHLLSRLRTGDHMSPNPSAEHDHFSMLAGTTSPSWDVVPFLPPQCSSCASLHLA